MNELLPLFLAFHLSVGGPAPDATVRTRIASPHSQRQADRWFAEDKLKHYFMSLAATNLAYGAARAAGLDGTPAVAAAAAAAGAAGVWKEWRDRRAGGPFSVKDLVWDGLGIGSGVLLAVGTFEE